MGSRRAGKNGRWLTRREVVVLGGLLGLSGCRPSARPRLPLIGYVQLAPNPYLDLCREAYIKTLAEAGYEDGKTAEVVVRNANGELPTLQSICQDLVDRRAALIATGTTPCLQAAMRATKEIPIVFSVISSPYAAGAGESAEKHRANVTGVSVLEPVDRAVELAKQIRPDVKKIGTLYDTNEAFTELFRKMGRETCARLGLEWIEAQVSTTTEIPLGVQALKSRGAEVIVQIPGNTLHIGVAGEAKSAIDLGLPFVSVEPLEAGEGALVGLGWDYEAASRQAAALGVRVLKGESPEKIPFQDADKRMLCVNLDTARKLRLELPADLVRQADKVFGKAAP